MSRQTRVALFTTSIALACLGSACTTPPAGETEPATAGNGVAANADGRPVRECRFAEGTGSKMRRRICHSQDEWVVLDAAAAEDQDTDEFFRRSREGGAAAGNVDAPDIGGGL